MRVVLLGTAGPAGWPEPSCRCASCSAVRSTLDARGPTAALVDEVLLIDGGPHAEQAAARLGVPLDRVRHTLLTTAATAGSPPHPVPPGTARGLGGWNVRALAGSEHSVHYDVTAPDGARLLYAPQPGTLTASTVDAVAGAGYRLAVLGSAGLAERLATLRRAGSLRADAWVVAVRLTHDDPPPAELAARLAGWGVKLCRDGTVLDTTGPAGEATPRRPHRTLVLGGARSGKSAWAESALAAEPEVTYVATAPPRPDDPEWTARVAAHRARRPAAWRTVQTSDLASLIAADDGPFLVDDVGNWLTTALDEAQAWTDTEGLPAALERADRLVEAWRTSGARVVAVSNEVGSGVVPATPSGRLFRDELGRLNARLAAAADEVVLLVAGLPTWVRGGTVAPAEPEPRSGGRS